MAKNNAPCQVATTQGEEQCSKASNNNNDGKE